jgi:hypothetical protein
MQGKISDSRLALRRIPAQARFPDVSRLESKKDLVSWWVRILESEEEFVSDLGYYKTCLHGG